MQWPCLHFRLEDEHEQDIDMWFRNDRNEAEDASRQVVAEFLGADFNNLVIIENTTTGKYLDKKKKRISSFPDYKNHYGK